MNLEFPRVEIGLHLVGKDFEPDEVTTRLNILPTNVRGKDDWPEVIKNLPDSYPDALKPRVTWSLETGKKVYDSVQEPFDNLLKTLFGKGEIIDQICRQYNLKSAFTIVIDMEEMNRPELFLTKEIISFAASINAEIGFDLYIY